MKDFRLNWWGRKDRIRNSLLKNGYHPTVIIVIIISIAALPACSYAFGSNNRRPPPPNQQNDRQLGPNNRPGHPPPPHHQSIRRQGLPFEGPPSNGNNNNNSPPIGHRRIQNHPHGPPPPHHAKHRGRPPFPFPRRRPPPPPPRGRGPPPRDRDQENRGRPPYNKQQSQNTNNNNNSPTQEPKLSFHIPPPPITTTATTQQHQDGFQQRPQILNGAESQNNFQNFQQNQFQQNHQQQNNQQHNQFQQNQQQFQQQQQFQGQSGQFPSLSNTQLNGQQNNVNHFQNQPTQFPNQQFQNNPILKHQLNHPQNPFQLGSSAIPPSFQPGPSSIPPTSFQPGPSGIPPTQQFPNQGFSQGFPSITNPPLPQMNPSQPPNFNNDHNQQLPNFHQHQPLFGQVNPPTPSNLPQSIFPQHHNNNNNNNPNNPPILEYAPPPNTFQSTPQPDANLLQDKSKEIELNSIPKQTITFTVTPKPSKSGGTQLHFKISTPKPFKTTLKPITNSKGYFKGSTYRPPVDKLNSKFKYSNSNPGYPDTEYRVQDGSRRESSMSAEMEPPPAEQSPSSIKDLLLNREHSLNQPPSPHMDDTDNYAGPSYDSPPVYVKPMSGEEVLIAGISTGKTKYHKGHPHDDAYRGPTAGQNFDEDYDNGAMQSHRNAYDEDDMGSKSYSDRHLHSYGPAKDNHFDEYSNGKGNDEQAYRRPSHSGSREENFDDFDHERNNQQRPLMHIEEESLGGSGESGKRGNNRQHGEKFSQPDPLYHPEDENRSGSKERDRDHGGEFEDLGTSQGDFGYGGSGERRHKDKDYLKASQTKSTAEELLAALGLSTNPLVSMPNSKYPIDIPTKYSRPGSGSWEKEYDSEPKRNKNKGDEDSSAGGNGEPMGLLEYLSQKKTEDNGRHPSHSTEPLYSVPDRPVAGSGENSFVVKGSMKAGSGGVGDRLHDVGKTHPHNVIVGRPIPQFQGTEPDIITKHNNPITQQSSYIEHKVKANPSYTSPTGQESYLYEKIHGSNPKNQPLQSVPVINTGLYGPSVPPPISEPGAFTDSPPILLSSVAPAILPVPVQLSPVSPGLHQHQPTIHNAAAPSAGGGESYLYQKIHGEKPVNLAAGLAFGPTPPSPHSVEDLSHSLYNGPVQHQHSGLYASPSEQITAATQQSSPTGLVYSNGKFVNPQQPQQSQTIGNGVLLPLGMGGNHQTLSPNSIPVNAPQQKLQSQQQQSIAMQSQTQPQILQPSGVPQQSSVLIAQQTAQGPLSPSVLIPQMSHQLQQVVPQQPQILQQPQQHQQQHLQFSQTFATGAGNPLLPNSQQSLVAQHSQNVPNILPPPTQPHQQQTLPQHHGNLYGSAVSQDTIDRSAQITQFSGEVGLHHQSHPNPSAHQTLGSPYHHQQQIQGQSPIAPQSPYSQQATHYQSQSPFGQQPFDPAVAASDLQHEHQYPSVSAVTPRYGHHGEAYPIYVTEPDPIIEIIVQDSNMTLPAMQTFPPPPPPSPPTPEPVHVFYVKYSQKNNTPVFDNYYGQSNPQIQLEQPISSVPVRGPDRNGMLPIDDTQDSLPQSSIQHQNFYNSVYSTSTDATPNTTPGPVTTTTLRTIIRPDRNEFSHASSGLVVSFDNPAVEQEIFANYTNTLMQQQQEAQKLAAQQQQEQQQFQQQAHSYPEITFPAQQQYQHYSPPDPYAQHQQQQQQAYPSLDSLWSGLQSEQKNVEQQQQQMQQEQQSYHQGFNKRIGLQELASLLETGPTDAQDEQKSSNQMNDPNAHQQQHQHQQQQNHYHHQQQDVYSQNDEQNPPPLYQYVESPHQSSISARQTKLPEDVPEELRNQLTQSGILGNADIQVINYSENLFKELGELPPEALAAFQAHTGDNGGGANNKQLDQSATGASPSSLEQSLWSGSQVSIANTDLSSLLPSGRSLRSVLVVKNSLRPKRGGRQRRVVLLITNKEDVLLYKPKDRSLKRIGNTKSSPLIQKAIELSNHKMDDEGETTKLRHSA